MPLQQPVLNDQGLISVGWLLFFQSLSTLALAGINVPGQNLFARTAQPTLAVADAGYIGWVTDYGHAVRWTGTVWAFAPGDLGNGFFRPYGVAPPEVGWAPCNGVATDYLVVGGATLTVTAFTPPDLNGTAAYLKSIAAYTGTINAAGGTTGTGTTGTGTTGTGTTGTEGGAGGHVHAMGTTTYVVTAGAGPALVDSLITGGGSLHSHSVPGLSVPGLSVPALGVGSLDVPNLGVLMYFRR